MPTKDYSLLAQQPLSARLCTGPERDAIVVSAIVDHRGQSHVLSRFGDMVWELWPFFEQANMQASCKRLDWSKLPAQFRGATKAVLYRYWLAGTPGCRPPSANTLRSAFTSLRPFLRYLGNRNITALVQVQALHVHNFLQEQLNAGRSPGAMAKYRMVIGMLYRLREEHPDGLMFDPWPEEFPGSMSGIAHRIAVARTPLIPRDILSCLFQFAENTLQRAHGLLHQRNAGRASTIPDRDMLHIRSACFFLIGLLTGMRCDEIAGIEVNAGRTEVKDGITYRWIRSIEHKTKKGYVEYLMPAMGVTILRIMERWSKPLRRRLREQLAALEVAPNDSYTAERLQRIAAARANVTRLFLGVSARRAEIVAISGTRWLKNMRDFASAAGVQWPLAPHQLRRMYAWTFVRHRLGNVLFLKEQFKHSSIEMTQLYAANPHQDPTLYDEILSELRDLKVEVIQHWLSDDVMLSGGAGRKIMVLRANSFANRRELIEDTADTVHIRSNGHAWCLAQDDGCGGAGLYERTRCADCSSGCIDDTHAAIWKEIYAHQRELAEDAKDLGPGARQRVERDRKVALQVLTDLGLAPEDQT